MDQACLFLYRKRDQTSAFSSKKHINWATDVLGKIKPRMGGPYAGRYVTTLKKIQTGMSWAAHVKKESLDGAAHNPADTCCPVIMNDTCQLPGFVVNLSPLVTTLKHLKNVTMLTNPWAPTSV